MAAEDNFMDNGVFKPTNILSGSFSLAKYVLLLFDDEFVFRGEDDILVREELDESSDGIYKPSITIQGTYGQYIN